MALKLEVFEDEPRRTGPQAVVLDASALEDERLSAFDKGYAAGWEDAAAAQSDDQARITAELARNLQALGFTFQEARSHVLRALEPLLTAIVGKLLPEMARDTLAPFVLETVMPLAEQGADAPVTLVLNPAARAPVEALLAQATGLPLQLVEEPTLGEGQVYVRLGDSETRVDLDQAIADIAAAVRSFFDLAEQEQSHG
jgi:flagellar assembly protein FliH